jgi:hypothetical protein
MIMPVLGEKLKEGFDVVRCTYKGNSNMADKTELWNNWNMMVQVEEPAGP